MNTQDDNKDIQLLKEELWNKRIMVEITMLRSDSVIEKIDLLKKLQ